MKSQCLAQKRVDRVMSRGLGKFPARGNYCAGGQNWTNRRLETEIKTPVEVGSSPSGKFGKILTKTGLVPEWRLSDRFVVRAGFRIASGLPVIRQQPKSSNCGFEISAVLAIMSGLAVIHPRRDSKERPDYFSEPRTHSARLKLNG